MSQAIAGSVAAFKAVAPGKTGVSVIIPVYRARMYLIDAIDSVYEQGLSHDEFEIIVVDDKYPSGNITNKAEHERVFRELGRRIAAEPEKYSNLKVIDSSADGVNKGVSAARNAGIRATKFPFISCLDADDMYAFDPGLLKNSGSYLKRAIEVLSDNPDLAMTDCECFIFGVISAPRLPLRWYFDAADQQIVSGIYLAGRQVFRKADALAINGYDETLRNREDFHFIARLLSHRVEKNLSTEVLAFPQAYYLYRAHPPGTQTVSAIPIDQEKYMQKLVADALPYFQRLYPELNGQKIIQSLLLDFDWVSSRINGEIIISQNFDVPFPYADLIRDGGNEDDLRYADYRDAYGIAAANKLVHPDSTEMLLHLA